MMNFKVSLILACTYDGGIGYNDTIPWHIPSELKKFKKITSKTVDKNKINAVIMGRTTWESIGKPLSNRLNIVLTHNRDYVINDKNVIVVHSVVSAFMHCIRPYIENIFIIGGTQLYSMFLYNNEYFAYIDKIYLSVLFNDAMMPTNKSISMDQIFTNFDLKKDAEYKKEADERVFASYICIPKQRHRRYSH